MRKLFISCLIILLVFNIFMYCRLHNKTLRFEKTPFNTILAILIAIAFILALMYFAYFLWTNIIPLIHKNFNFTPHIIGG